MTTTGIYMYSNNSISTINTITLISKSITVLKLLHFHSNFYMYYCLISFTKAHSLTSKNSLVIFLSLSRFNNIYFTLSFHIQISFSFSVCLYGFLYGLLYILLPTTSSWILIRNQRFLVDIDS